MAGKKTGRRTKLTPEVQDKIVQAVRGGNFFNTACEYAGIGERTGYRWLEMGEAATSESDPLRQFWQAIKKAEADAEAESLITIRKAARGGQAVKTKTITKYHPDGSVKEMVEEKQLQPPEWTAAAWYLERKYKDRWGRVVKQEVSGKDGGPVEVEVSDAKQKLAERLARLNPVADPDSHGGDD